MDKGKTPLAIFLDFSGTRAQNKLQTSNKLTLNCKKSKFIVFYKPPRKTVIPEILIDNENICCVDEFIFLRLTITRHLSWKNILIKYLIKLAKYLVCLIN